jgi:hypothetical protein
MIKTKQNKITKRRKKSIEERWERFEASALTDFLHL